MTVDQHQSDNNYKAGTALLPSSGGLQLENISGTLMRLFDFTATFSVFALSFWKAGEVCG